jgi:hypothetical protein
MRRRWAAVVLAAALASVLPGAPASAQDLSVEIGFDARLIDPLTAALRIRYRCPAELTLQEALAYITQDGQTSQFSPIDPVCDGTLRTAFVRIHAFEEAPFHRGSARATAYLLMEDPATHDTVDAGDTGRIRLRVAPD